MTQIESLLCLIFQPLDFETRRTHNVVVEAVNKHVDPRFVDLGSFRDQTIVRVSVTDVDEPPTFQPPDGTIMEVQEDAKVGALVGVVSASDPDVKNKSVRYDIELAVCRRGWTRLHVYAFDSCRNCVYFEPQWISLLPLWGKAYLLPLCRRGTRISGCRSWS